MCSFLCKYLLHISVCTKHQPFWFSTFRNSWMKIVSKDFCIFTGVYIAIYMGPCRGSYILLVRKFRTSEMLDKWGPTSKLSDIKLLHIPNDWYIFFTFARTHLSTIPIKLVFWYLQIFPRVYYDIVNFECWITSQLYQFRYKCATIYVCITFLGILRTSISPDFTWIFIE